MTSNHSTRCTAVGPAPTDPLRQAGGGQPATALRWWLLIALLFLCAACQPKAPPRVTFEQALQATPLGPSPAEAYFLVDLLAKSGEPQQADQLRRTLWQRQLALLRGEAAAPPFTLQAGVAHGATLPDVPAMVAAEWDRTYRATTRVRFDEPGDPQRLPWQSARNLAPGLWVGQERPGGPLHFSLDVRLEQPGLQALPTRGLRLQFGDAADAPVLACRPSGHQREVAAVTGTQRHTRSVPILACTGTGDARWESLLPVLVEAARQGGAQPRIASDPPDVSQQQAVDALWRSWGTAGGPATAFGAAWKRSRDPTMARHSWVAAAGTLKPPTAVAPPPTLAEVAQTEARAAWQRLKPVLIALCVAFFAFAVVRVSMPNAGPLARARVSFVLCLVMAVPVLYTAVDWRGGGDGWANLGRIGAGYGVMVGAGMTAMIAAMLHWLHGLLDDEDLTWTHTIAVGWSRMFQLVGGASRAEFWGFFVFALGVRAVAVALGPPWTNPLTLVVAAPLVTLLLRRMQAMTVAEWITVFVLVALMAANVVLPD